MTTKPTVADTLKTAVDNVRPIVERERAAEGFPPSAPTPLRVSGVGRVARSIDPPESFEHQWLQVYFNRPYSDDEMRAFHDYVRAFPARSTSE